jgi:hypothetical protein
MERKLALIALLLAACDDSKQCEGPSLALSLTFFGPEHVESLLVTYEGDGIDAREIHNVQGAPELSLAAMSAPNGREVTLSVRAYDNEDVRGRLLAEGSIGPLVIDACDRLELELSDRFLIDKDAGTDAGTAADASEDAGADAAIEDSGELDPDAGVPTDAGDPICSSMADGDTLALFPFDGAEAASGMVKDVVSGITGVAQPAQGAVASTPGPNACGDAAAFLGFGYLEIPDEGLAPVVGSVDFYVRFDGAHPTARQGIVSRDAQGQTTAGHITFYRTCDEHLVVRVQDLERTVFRCSDRPLTVGQWTHVALDFGDPQLVLAIDGQVATSTGTRLSSPDCVTAQSCDRNGVFSPSSNQNPWVLGADTANSAEGAAEPSGNYFFGAIDQFRVSGARRFP